MGERPTKDAIMKLISDKRYNIVSSGGIVFEYSPKKHGKYKGKETKDLSRYIGRVLSSLEKEGILAIESRNSMGTKYRVNYDMLDALISQSSPQ